jgi:hypothetical protein
VEIKKGRLGKREGEAAALGEDPKLDRLLDNEGN